MTKKNKGHQRQVPRQPERSAPPFPAPLTTTVAHLASSIPGDAVVAIERTYLAALNSATPADVERAKEASESPPSIDLAAAAKLAQDALALCQSREERLRAAEAAATRRNQLFEEHERHANEREQQLTATEARLQKERAEVESKDKRLRAEQMKLLQQEQAIRSREINAEAGFATERRASLREFEAEVATLRKEISESRAYSAKERAEWQARWRKDDESLRAEQDTRRDAQDRSLRVERARMEEEIQGERDRLARERSELKKEAQRADVERELLHEDREAFSVRVERRVAALIEEARARHDDLEARLSAARQERDRLYERLRGHDDAERRLGNRPLDEIKRELDSLTLERDSLRQQLATRPSADAVHRMQELERAREEWEGEHDRLRQHALELKSGLARASIAVTELETLRDQKAALESGRDLLQAALAELRKDVNERIRRADGVSPFPACALMDMDPARQTSPPAFEDITSLETFCLDLQHRIARDPKSDRELYYSLSDIRCFLGGLAMSRLHLLHGISGTGKTSLPLAFARAIGAGSTLIEVQAGWRDRADLLGHFNVFEKRYHESEFLQALYRAQCPSYSDLPYVIVLDEMNLSHPEQYFADVLSAMELDGPRQKLDLMPSPVEPAPALLRDGRTLPLPPNVWFIGTANHDETTKDFADKTYDRAHVMELPRHRELFTPQNRPARSPVALAALRGAFDTAQGKHAADAREAYQFLDQNFADLLGRRFRVGWGNRLERQMMHFVPVVIAAGGDVGEALDHILASKLLRKVRDRHDTRPQDLDELKNKLAQAWIALDKSAPTRSNAIINTELRRLGAEEDNA